MNTTLPQYAKLLERYLRPQWRKVALLALLMLSGIGLQLAIPQILRYFIDAAQAGPMSRPLATAALGFLAINLVNQATSALATYLGADIGWTATNRLRADLALHCLRLDMPFHNSRTPGEMIERLDGDVTALSNFFSQFMVRILSNGLLLVGVLVVLFLEDARVGAALTLFTAVAFVVLTLSRKIAVAANVEEREASAQFMGFLEERLAGLHDIRANGAGAYAMRRFYQSATTLYQKGRRAWQRRSIIWILIMAVFMLGEVLAFALGVFLFLRGAVTLGTVYLFFQYTAMLRNPIEQISRQMEQLQAAAASIGRIRDLWALQPGQTDGDAPLPAGPLSIAFDGVTFAYGDADPVLKGVSFRLSAGRVLGLLGRTGSGKTTLTRLLFRLYDPGAGRVRVGGVDTRRARLAELRARVGLVTQDVQLFHATVRDNLTFFDTRISDEHILRVLDELHLRPWLDALPHGLDSELAANGSGLSAGEAQLLALTRIFLQDPGLVILDEPSSRLDPATEHLLEQAVSRLLHNRTAIIIAHRLKTVLRADDILILEHGEIREHGARAALEGNPDSRFAQLLRIGLEKELA